CSVQRPHRIQTIDFDKNSRRKGMFKALYMFFAAAVLLAYASAAWFGWEIANSGSRSRLGIPFIYTGFRGGK
ncbi:hypothetical protein OFB92_33750, partial [Escherichia coli]|nr:hypothetical protein [Escherichia coli]